MLLTDLLSSVSSVTFPIFSRSLLNVFFRRRREERIARTQRSVIPVPRAKRMRNRRVKIIGARIRRRSKGRSLLEVGVVSPARELLSINGLY